MKTRQSKTAAKQHPTLSHEALLGKARLYFGRALASKAAKEDDTYQLWSVLGLELLAKGSLSRIHPSLVVEAANPNSLLEANGIATGTAVRTIDAQIAFARLKHTVPHFGTPIFKACETLASRRNAELHSGQAAYVGLSLDAWEGDLWSATQLILESIDLDLDSWLGEGAKEPKTLLTHLRHVKMEAAKQRVEHAKTMFDEDGNGKKRSKRDKDILRDASINLSWYQQSDRFRFPLKSHWREKCPACESLGFVGGDKIFEETADDQDDADIGYEMVDVQYSLEEFLCPTCGLHVDGADALRAVGFDEVREDQEEREIEYEPDYGND